MMRWRKWYASGRHSGTCSANSGHRNRILMYYLFRFASVVIPRLPRWFVLTLANVISPVAWLVAGKNRKKAKGHIFPLVFSPGRATRAGRERLCTTVRRGFRDRERNPLAVVFFPYNPQD